MRLPILCSSVLLAKLASGACLAPVPTNECPADPREISWKNPIEERRASIPADAVDSHLRDPAFGAGVLVSGDLVFGLRVDGPQVAEILVAEQTAEEFGYVLESNGKLADDRWKKWTGPERLYPRRGRALMITGIVAPGVLRVKTDGRNYVFSAIRLTPVARFEEDVPRLRQRLEHLLRQPYFGVGERGASLRARGIDQVGSLLRLSRDPEARRQGLLAQTRASYWLAAENHRPREIARTADLFREALRIMPDEPVLRQMISSSCRGINSPIERMPQGEFCQTVQPVPWDVDVPPDPPGAPEWAVAQRRLKRRMDAITGWWVVRRQQSGGELGGGWGDDVEMLRNWGPQALGLGSEVAHRGIVYLADGLWRSGDLRDGYAAAISDVEHSSEPSTDTLPLRAAVLPDPPESRLRLAMTAACAKRWIARQADGKYRFRGSWFNCTEFDPSEKRAVDTHMNTRALGPVLWSAYLDRDPQLIERIELWAESWAAAMRDTRHGKPKGLIPSVLRSRDGEYLLGATWDKPQAEWDYFQWSGRSQEGIASLFLALHDLTGKQKWLDAAAESFALLADCGGYQEYCDAMRSSPESWNEYQRRTGKAPPRPAAEALAAMTRFSRELEQRIAVNFDMYTSEVLWTDRVYYTMAPAMRELLFGGEAPRGDRYPMFAVTWPPSVLREFARAVLDWSDRGLTFAAYNFEDKPIAAQLRLWRLAPGSYRWTSSNGARGSFELARLPQAIEIPLPARQEVTVSIAPAK